MDVKIPVPYVHAPREDADETTNSYELEIWDVFAWTDHPSWGTSLCVGRDRRTGIPIVVGMAEKGCAECCDEGFVTVVGQLRFRDKGTP